MAQDESSVQTPSNRRIRIEELYTNARDQPLSPKLSGPVSEMHDEIRNMYLHEYGKGMDQFLETSWYTEQGLRYLLQDADLCQKFGGMLELFTKTKANDYENFLKIPQIEARVTWMLFCLPRLVSAQIHNGNEPLNVTSPDPQLVEVLRRLDIFEHLITNNALGQNPLAGDGDPILILSRERQYWRQLGVFVSLQSTNEDGREMCLRQLRQLLDQRENRDVLYSMALVRHLRVLPASNSTETSNEQTSNGDERLIVAKKFIEDEASSKGTTQVVQRLCGMAVRSWAAVR